MYTYITALSKGAGIQDLFVHSLSAALRTFPGTYWYLLVE